MSLEGIGIGAGFIGPHAGAVLAILLQGLHHHLDMLGIVHGAQAGKQVEVVLPEADPVIFKRSGSMVVFVPAQDTVLL